MHLGSFGILLYFCSCFDTFCIILCTSSTQQERKKYQECRPVLLALCKAVNRGERSPYKELWERNQLLKSLIKASALCFPRKAQRCSWKNGGQKVQFIAAEPKLMTVADLLFIDFIEKNHNGLVSFFSILRVNVEISAWRFSLHNLYIREFCSLKTTQNLDIIYKHEVS